MTRTIAGSKKTDFKIAERRNRSLLKSPRTVDFELRKTDLTKTFLIGQSNWANYKAISSGSF
jgi:hypothetical protein